MSNTEFEAGPGGTASADQTLMSGPGGTLGRPKRKRPIKVIVSGERGSGKTTLIAVLAQALRGADHLVTAPKHVPKAAEAIADLREQFDIIIEEHDQGQPLNVDDKTLPTLEGYYALQHELEALKESLGEVRTDKVTVDASGVPGPTVEADANPGKTAAFSAIRAQAEKINAMEAGVAQLVAENSRLRQENDLLRTAQDYGVPSGVADRAIAIIRDAVIIERDKRELDRSVREMQRKTDHMSNEIEARYQKARDMLTNHRSGKTQAPRMSAEQKLAIANGAEEPYLTGAQVMEGALKLAEDRRAYAADSVMFDQLTES